jgi:hypothetical protein
MSDSYLTLKQAQEHLPGRNGKPLSVQAIRRRIRNGIRGIRLRATNNGCDWFTKEAWIREFLDQTTGEPVEGCEAGLGHAQAMETLKLRYGFDAAKKVHGKRLQKRRRVSRALQEALPGSQAARKGRLGELGPT